MATASGFVRRLSLLTSGRPALKGALLSAPTSLWFLLFLLLPMGIVVLFGFATISEATLSISYQQLTFENYLYALNPLSPVLPQTAWTLFVAAVTTLGCLAIGYPVAYYLAWGVSDRRRGLLMSLIIIPFWVSFVVQVYALYPWVQREGYVGGVLDALGGAGFADVLFANFGFGSARIVPLVLVWIWLPFMILPIFTAILRIDRELLDAAQDLGAGKWRTFWSVSWPLSFPGVLTGSILVFITAFGSFVEPALLAGQEGQLIGNFIYYRFLELGDLPIGAAASVIVLAATVLLLYVYVKTVGESGAEFGEGFRASEILARASDRLARLFARPSRAAVPHGMPGGNRPVRGRLERAWDRLAERRGRPILLAFTALVLLSFYAPLAQVVAFSFNDSPNIIQWGGFSLKWYYRAPGEVEELRALFNDQAMIDAMKNSFFVGVIVTGVSLLLGTPAALAISRYRFWTKRYLNLMLYTGLVIPSIVLGVSILVFITILNDLYLWPYAGVWWDTGYLSIIVGHVTFAIPIVIVVLLVSLREFDRSLEEAAMDLGANEWTTFFRVTLPIIKPGIISAALLAFTFSFDELIVTLFLQGQGIQTLPVVMWSTLVKKIPSPELNAASTVILGIAIVFTVLATRVQKGGAMFRF